MAKLASVIVLPLTLAAIAAGPAAAAPTPLRIAGISPAVADRGELVTITGGGFGARNLEVTVGGDPVELVSATGSRASFRVPLLGAVGDVTVVARNPGGITGRIGLRVRFDGSTVAVADEAAAVSEPVGAEGGTIEVEGMTLAVPSGAVPEGTTITATPLRSLEGSPFAAAPVGVKLEPSGLVLLRPATLTLPKPSGPGTVVGFGFNGEGEGFRLLPHRLVGEEVELKVWHFSGAGTTTVSAAELQAALGYLPTPAHELAEQKIAAAIASEATGGEPPAQAIFDALVAWRTSSVIRGLDLAEAEARLDYFELAFGEWLAWRSYAQEYDDLFDATQRSFVVTATGLDRDIATNGAVAVARVLLPRCTGPGVPLAALRDVIRLASAVNLDTLPLNEESAQDGTGRNLPDGRNLATSCVDVHLLEIQHASALARNRDNRIVTRAQVVFWKGDPSSTVALSYRIADSTAAPLPLASGTSSTGTFETTVSPGSLGARRVEVTVELDSSDSVLRTFFDQESFFITVRERLELDARRPGAATFTDNPGAIASNTSLTLRIRLAGDAIDNRTIVFTHDGTGTLPASATTNASGEAFVTYTAPATATTELIELVTATITDAGRTTGDALTITTRPTVAVAVTPTFAFASPGGTVRFTATVTGSANTAVTWSAAGGTIDGSGLFTAGSNPGVFAVTATSSADPTSTDTAFVQITATDVSGLYAGERCFLFAGEVVSCGQAWLRYGCNRTSRIGNGTVCGWSTTFNPEIGFPRVNVPAAVFFCEVETSGTRAGGSFTGRITFCHPPPLSGGDASIYGTVSITGSIEGTRLTMSVLDGGTVFERYVLTKVG